MDKIAQPLKTGQTDDHPQVLSVDGCKVTVRYGDQKNPRRISEIKSLLLSAQFSAKKE